MTTRAPEISQPRCVHASTSSKPGQGKTGGFHDCLFSLVRPSLQGPAFHRFYGLHTHGFRIPKISVPKRHPEDRVAWRLKSTRFRLSRDKAGKFGLNSGETGFEPRGREMEQGPSAKRQRRVLVAVDESEESMYAFSWAVHHLLIGADDEFSDTVILLHAQSLRRVYTAVDGTAYVFSSDIAETMERYERTVSESIFEKATGICSGRNIIVETNVQMGDPRDVICEQAEKLGPDFLVVGSHGYGAIKRAFLGSVSDYCAHHVKCPVLIVKRPQQS